MKKVELALGYALYKSSVSSHLCSECWQCVKCAHP